MENRRLSGVGSASKGAEWVVHFRCLCDVVANGVYFRRPERGLAPFAKPPVIMEAQYLSEVSSIPIEALRLLRVTAFRNTTRAVLSEPFFSGLLVRTIPVDTGSRELLSSARLMTHTNKPCSRKRTTTRLYDRRKTRPEESPTFKVSYRSNSFVRCLMTDR
jgi:hypothetical protein